MLGGNSGRDEHGPHGWTGDKRPRPSRLTRLVTAKARIVKLVCLESVVGVRGRPRGGEFFAEAEDELSAPSIYLHCSNQLRSNYGFAEITERKKKKIPGGEPLSCHQIRGPWAIQGNRNAGLKLCRKTPKRAPRRHFEVTDERISTLFFAV